jgi:hypothetical protein
MMVRKAMAWSMNKDIGSPPDQEGQAPDPELVPVRAVLPGEPFWIRTEQMIAIIGDYTPVETLLHEQPPYKKENPRMLVQGFPLAPACLTAVLPATSLAQ